MNTLLNFKSTTLLSRVSVFLVFILLTSCAYFNVKKTSSEAILEEELQSFKWNEVDEYHGHVVNLPNRFAAGGPGTGMGPPVAAGYGSL